MNAGLLLSDDLLFASQLMAAGPVIMLRDAKSLLERAKLSGAQLVFIDLQVAGSMLHELIAGLRQLDPPPRIVGFGSHVMVDVLKAAREAGCDEVLPRSKFSERLAACGLAGFQAKPQAAKDEAPSV